jgi:hypothetical protein
MTVECTSDFLFVFEIAAYQMQTANQRWPPFTMDNCIATELLANAMNCHELCHELSPKANSCSLPRGTKDFG